MSVYKNTLLASAGNSSGSGGLGQVIRIGQTLQGGHFAGIIREGGTSYNLISRVVEGGNIDIQTNPVAISVIAGNRINGMENTEALVLQSSAFNGAIEASSFVFGAFTDWYLPARDEVEVIWRAFRFPVTSRTNFITPNNFDGQVPGYNPNSVPAGNPYFQSSPNTLYIPQSYPSTIYSSTLAEFGGQKYSIAMVEADSGLSLERVSVGGADLVVARRELAELELEESRVGDYTGYSAFNCGTVVMDNSITYRLLCAPLGTDRQVQYRTSAIGNSPLPGSNLYDGSVNTSILLATGQSPAATFASQSRNGGLDLWYVPSLWEMYAIYVLMGSIDSTYTHRAVLPSDFPWSVLPVRNASSGGNAQTKIDLHKQYKIFANEFYLTSSQDPSSSVNYLAIKMSDSSIQSVSKTSPRRTKIIRKVPYGPEIGSSYRGGYYAGIVMDDGIAWRLIVSPKSTQVNSVINASASPSAVGPNTDKDNGLGIYTLTNGPRSSKAMIAAGSTWTAAEAARSLSSGGFKDWYIPSRDELAIAYWNLKPTSSANVTGSPSVSVSQLGFNILHGGHRGIPPRGGFTLSNPLQTQVPDFLSGTGAHSFDAVNYISSSCASDSNAFWGVDFSDGEYAISAPNVQGTLRCFRREPVGPDFGEFYRGGFMAGYIMVGTIIYRLIVSPKVGGEFIGLWRNPSAIGNGGAFSLNDGMSNTNQMMASDSVGFPGARFCSNLILNEYDDWYMPSRDEMEIVVRNLTLNSSITGNRYSGNSGNGDDGLAHGTNFNSVPNRFGYSEEFATPPSSTKFTLGAEEEIFGLYWTSTVFVGSIPWYHNTQAGQFATDGTNNSLRVRAIRRERV